MTRVDISSIGLTAAARKRIASRRLMLLAGLKLIQKGRYRLTPDLIADTAQMHKRSFHSIFGDLPSYYTQLIETHETSIREEITRVVKSGKSLVEIVLLGE